MPVADRAGTVALLEKLIAEAKAQGYTFTTLAPILPPQYVPQKDVTPSMADQATLSVAPGCGTWLPREVLAGSCSGSASDRCSS